MRELARCFDSHYAAMQLAKGSRATGGNRLTFLFCSELPGQQAKAGNLSFCSASESGSRGARERKWWELWTFGSELLLGVKLGGLLPHSARDYRIPRCRRLATTHKYRKRWAHPVLAGSIGRR